MNRLTKFLSTTVIGGVAVILPIVIFVWVIRLLLQLLHAIIAPLSGLINLELPGLLVDVIAFVIVIAFCFVMGLFVRTQFGGTFYKYVEREWFERLPVYASIRDIVQQFTGFKKTPFTQVVLIEVFGTQMTGFVTDENGDDVTVFVPTSPNPTNGFVFHTKRQQLQYLDVRTEDALKTIVGMGAGSQEMLTRLLLESAESKVAEDHQEQ